MQQLDLPPLDFDVRWEPLHRVAHVTHRDVRLDSMLIVSAWRDQLFARLDTIKAERGGKFPIVVCIDNFTIRPSVADDYGLVVRALNERYAAGVVRYGAPALVKQIIAVEALKAGFRANLCASFDEALAALVELGSLPPTVRGSALVVRDAPTQSLTPGRRASTSSMPASSTSFRPRASQPSLERARGRKGER